VELLYRRLVGALVCLAAIYSSKWHRIILSYITNSLGSQLYEPLKNRHFRNFRLVQNVLVNNCSGQPLKSTKFNTVLYILVAELLARSFDELIVLVRPESSLNTRLTLWRILVFSLNL